MKQKKCSDIAKEFKEPDHEKLIKELVNCEANEPYAKAKTINDDNKYYNDDPYPLIEDDEVREKTILEDIGVSVEKPLLSPDEEMSAPNMRQEHATDVKREP
ncbi:MAG: hypothetical protein Q4P29_05500 [Tissierellia bacterium]|nr:hypothetical protein [Tissierellia bacterium]